VCLRRRTQHALFHQGRRIASVACDDLGVASAVDCWTPPTTNSAESSVDMAHQSIFVNVNEAFEFTHLHMIHSSEWSMRARQHDNLPTRLSVVHPCVWVGGARGGNRLRDRVSGSRALFTPTHNARCAL
jgi:hypothetical protein